MSKKTYQIRLHLYWRSVLPMKNQHSAKQEKYHLIHFTPKCPTKWRTAWHYTAGPDGTPFLSIHTHTNHTTAHNIEEKQQPVMQKSPCTTHPFTASISTSTSAQGPFNVQAVKELQRCFSLFFECEGI